MRLQSASKLLVGALAAVVLPSAVEAKICLMVYQMADNNLEYYIRQDMQELSESNLVRSADVRTWIYFDALNQGGAPLPNTVDSSGNALSSTFTGSRYITYDPSFGRMRVDQELSGEQNSDTGSLITGFLGHALNDCLANGFTSLMAVFASHGGGFAGYGGDENGRKLLQTNSAIAGAIQSALSSSGASGKLEVLGFDACLMQAVDAADDYKDVASYILASEAVEPGHGWAYKYLEPASTALELAGQVVSTFLSQTQGGSSHQTPKTLSIIDTAKYMTFITAFDSFHGTALSLMQAGDVSLYAQVSRARSSSVAFESVVDAIGTPTPSGVDVGSWLYKFKETCNPGEPLQTQLDTAIAAYNAMFVAQGVGPSTAAGTGIHITFPTQATYNGDTAVWDQILFNNANYVTQIAPNFRAFLSWFLPSSSPSGDASVTVCGQGVAAPAAEVASADPNALILTDSGVSNPTTGLFDLAASISPAVSEMLVEYGIDLSTPLKPVLEEKGYTPTDDEYLYLLGGDVMGSYEGSDYKASWDQNFYFLNITGTDTFEALYVKDLGGGSRQIPAMYFPEDHREDVSKLQFLDFLHFDFDGWIEKGARYSFLRFSVDEADGRINDNLSLFIANADGVFAEQPRSAKGLMIPLIKIDAYIQGRKLDTLPGGFNQTFISWSEDLAYNILTTPYSRIFDVIPSADAIVINMYAHSGPGVEPDKRFYDVKRARGVKPGTLQLQPASTGSSPTQAAPTEDAGSQSSSSQLGMGKCFLLGISMVVFGLF